MRHVQHSEWCIRVMNCLIIQKNFIEDNLIGRRFGEVFKGNFEGGSKTAD